MRSSSLLKDPRLGIVGLGVILVIAAAYGQFWPAVVMVGLLLVFFFGRLCSLPAGKVAFIVLLAGHVLMVVEPLRPEQYNYMAYGVGLATVIAVARVSRSDLTPAALALFLAVLFGGAAYSTIALKSAAPYQVFVVPLGLTAGYLIGRRSSSHLRSYVLRGLLLFAVGESLLGVSQTVMGTPPFVALGSPVFSEPRNYLALLLPFLPAQVRMATGTFEHFNGLAPVLALCTPLALWYWLDRKSSLNAFVLLVVVAGLVSTFSRGSLLGAVTACTLLIYARMPKGEAKVLRVSFGVLMLTIAGVLGAGAIESYARTTGNFVSRMGAWQVALGATVSDPVRVLVGAGYGFYGAGFLADYGAITRLHSFPVQVFAELGALGVALALVAFVPSIKRGLLAGGQLETALAAACLAFFVAQIFDNAYFAFPGMLLMTVFGMLVAVQRADSCHVELNQRVGWS